MSFSFFLVHKQRVLEHPFPFDQQLVTYDAVRDFASSNADVINALILCTGEV